MVDDPGAVLPLLVGIFHDTGFLKRAGPQTVRTGVNLLQEVGERAEEIPALLVEEPAGGEQNARAIGPLRASGYRAGDLIQG